MEGTIKIQQKGIYRNKSFMLLLLGQIVSNLGNAALSVAAVWFIMDMVGEGLSGSYMAMFAASTLIPEVIFSPFAGVYVDRLNRKNIIVWSDIIRGVLTLILALFLTNNLYPILALFIITGLRSLAGAFFNPAVDASIPNLVEEKDLTLANSLNGISRQLTWVIGGAISGFLYYNYGIVGIVFINGIAFILSGISEIFIDIPQMKKKNDERASIWKDFRGGIEYVKGEKIILRIMFFTLVLCFLVNPIFQVVFPKVIKFTMGMGAREYGIIQALFSVGAIIGMIWISKLANNGNGFKYVKYSLVIFAFLFIAFGIPILPLVISRIGNLNAYIMYCVFVTFIMMFNSIIIVPLFTALQKKVPDDYRGRFFALFNTTSQAIVPVGLAVFGILADFINPSVIFIGSGVVFLVTSVWFSVTSGLDALFN